MFRNILSAVKFTIYCISALFTPFITLIVIIKGDCPATPLEWGLLIGLNIVHIVGIIEIGTLIKDYFFINKKWNEVLAFMIENAKHLKND